MQQTIPAIRDLSKRILAEEAHSAFNAFEKLRQHLAKLIGIAGFQSRLARSLVLAKPEALWLLSVRVGSDGTLEEIHEGDPPSEALVAEGYTALLAQFLALLVTFIGESLMLRLVQEIWPTVRLNDMNSPSEETTT